MSRVQVVVLAVNLAPSWGLLNFKLPMASRPPSGVESTTGRNRRTGGVAAGGTGFCRHGARAEGRREREEKSPGLALTPDNRHCFGGAATVRGREIGRPVYKPVPHWGAERGMAFACELREKKSRRRAARAAADKAAQQPPSRRRGGLGGLGCTGVVHGCGARVSLAPQPRAMAEIQHDEYHVTCYGGAKLLHSHLGVPIIYLPSPGHNTNRTFAVFSQTNPDGPVADFLADPIQNSVRFLRTSRLLLWPFSAPLASRLSFWCTNNTAPR